MTTQTPLSIPPQYVAMDFGPSGTRNANLNANGLAGASCGEMVAGPYVDGQGASAAHCDSDEGGPKTRSVISDDGSGFMNMHIDTRLKNVNGEGFDGTGPGEIVAGPFGDGQGAMAAHCDDDGSRSKVPDRSSGSARTLSPAPSARQIRLVK